ncbi:MAG: N-6 DNA methylase [Nanoarchaeota archaeon]
MKDSIINKDLSKTEIREKKNYLNRLNGINIKMAHSNNPTNSEVDAYSYIKEELEKLGWIVKNPARVPEGEVYKQNECLANDDIKKAFGTKRPEAVIKLNEIEVWVIESKREKKEIDRALEEAKNYYARRINDNSNLKCIIASGIAGNDTDGYTIVNEYLHKGKWEKILFNGKPKDTLLSKEQANYLLSNKTPNWQEFPDFPEEKYLGSAENINEILHNAGVNKNKRARFLAGLVLSLSIDSEIDLREKDTTTLVENVNTLIKKKLREVKKEGFYDYIKLEVPPIPENHIKYRKAVIDTLKELQTLDIKNAMASGNDILGKFYEKFLKYGNGAKEIGIVLTPRHITKFGVEVLDVKNSDYILDPACGTGGFLVSAFDYIKKNSNAKQIDKFKNYNLFGIEQDDEVVALALVNMIFRGDGRNNMMSGNCFQKNINKITKDSFETGKEAKREGTENKNPVITKVLMNPPFALKKGEEKEYKFVDYGLSQMEDGGLLFVIIPSPIMFKGMKVREWRKEMLKHNTLKAVIKLPEDLFYPVGVVTSAVIIQKGVPHNFKKDVFWGRLEDGYIKKKGVMRKKSNGNIETIKSLVKDFLNGSITQQKNVPKLYSIEPILYNEEDKDLECAPEYYLKEDKHNNKEIIQQMRHTHLNLVNHLINNPFFKGASINLDTDCAIKSNEQLSDLFTIENAKSKNIEDYGNGEMPFITSTTTNNGVEMYIDEDEEELIYRKPCITLSSFGLASVQIMPFVARSHGAVLVLIPNKDMSLRQLLYYASQINIHNWRFSYGRWVTKKRLLKLEIPNITQMKLPTIEEIKEPFEKSLNFIKSTF